MLRAAFALVLVAGLTSLSFAQSQTTDPKLAEVVDRASRFVEEYQKALPAIVCEEQQTQQLIRADGRAGKTRALVSDMMYVKTGDIWVPHVFRDVLSVDGKTVRDRSDRLRKLFVEHPKTAVEQARAIAAEGGRYNLGKDRTGNSPLLPMLVLDSHIRSRFQFSLSGSTLSFVEEQRPTFLSFVRNGQRSDLPAHGSLTIDLETGKILSGTLTAEAPGRVSTTFAARYAEDPGLKMIVPVEMRESYWYPEKPKDDRLEAKMTYSAFRRFTVTTSEIIK